MVRLTGFEPTTSRVGARQGDGDAFLVEGVAFGVEGDALEQGSDAFE